MTGQEVKWIREALGLSVTHLADLLAVHFTTVFRWEAAGVGECKAEGMARHILGWLGEAEADPYHVDFGIRLHERLRKGGILKGLGFLMGWVEGVRSRVPSKRMTNGQVAHGAPVRVRSNG